MYMDDNFFATDFSTSTKPPRIWQLSSRAEWELLYHRYGHDNNNILEHAHKYTRGVTKLKKLHFYKCSSCSRKIKKETSVPTKSAIKKDLKPKEHIHPRQHLHMDFGFVRGTAYQRKNEDGKIVTSIEILRSYLMWLTEHQDSSGCSSLQPKTRQWTKSKVYRQNSSPSSNFLLHN